MIDPVASQPVQAGPARDMQHEKLKKACAEFESLFLTYLLKSMRAAIPQDGMAGRSEEGKMFDAMFDENLANEVALSGGLGLGEILLSQLGEKIK